MLATPAVRAPRSWFRLSAALLEFGLYSKRDAAAEKVIVEGRIELAVTLSVRRTYIAPLAPMLTVDPALSEPVLPLLPTWIEPALMLYVAAALVPVTMRLPALPLVKVPEYVLFPARMSVPQSVRANAPGAAGQECPVQAGEDQP